jgi:hypothetical protein
MKSKLLFILFFFTVFTSWGQSIWTNPITGTDPGLTTPYTTGQIVDPNLASVSGISRTGILGNAANDRYNAKDWGTTTIDIGKYFEFTLTPNAGYPIDFLNLAFNYSISASAGPTSFAVRSSADGYTANITTFTGALNSSGVAQTIDLSAATFKGITTAITFRIYGWNSSASSGTFSVDNFTFNGYVRLPCTYSGGTLTKLGTDQIVCFDTLPTNPSNLSIANDKAGNYVVLNVVKGFNYTFAVSDAFSPSSTETLTVFDDANPIGPTLAGNTGSTGASVTWTATFSGKVRILLSKNACVHDNSGSGTLTIALNSLGNTQDSQTNAWSNQWIGHIYNYPGGNAPGGASPATLPTNVSPFLSTDYVGYYIPVSGTEKLDDNFNGASCFPVLSNGTNRTNINTETFAVRYRMNSTKTGCYLITMSGDDGIRLYLDGNRVNTEWNDQGITTYSSVLVNLTGANTLVYDYYENAGGNTVTFDMVSYVPSSNAITPTTPIIVCNATAPPPLIGNLAYNNTQLNPTINFQWQDSPDGLTFSNIPGATNKDYAPPATSPGGITTKYFRRVATGVAPATSCTFNSNVVTITTSPAAAVPVAPVATAATYASCGQITANWTSSTLPNYTNYLLDVSTSNSFATFVSGYNGLNVGNVTSYPISGLNSNTIYYYRVRAITGCGTQSANSNIISGTTGVLPTSPPQVGGAQTLCIDSTVTTATVNAGECVLVNVVKGFTYAFAVGEVFVGDSESLTLLDTTNTPILPSASSAGLTGTTLTWVATLSGQIKILLSKGFCVNNNSPGGALTLSVSAVGNTQDTQTTRGANQWIGYVYNSALGGSPGGNPGPLNVSITTVPFTDANYAGYYNPTSGTEVLNENFGGTNNCFSILSNGVNRTNIFTEGFAVRYRMKWTGTAGCYLVTATADDGARLYVDNVKVFEEWKDQAPTAYASILINLTNNSDLVFDYYENAGGNNVSFSMVPFTAATNTITAPVTTSVCSTVAPGTITGSFAYNGTTANPSISYQWQVSSTGLGGSYTNIPSATAIDYAPLAITTATTDVKYYQRVVKGAFASTASCTFTSSPVIITTSPATPSTPGTISGKTLVCNATTGLVYSVAPVANAVSYTWTLPANWTITAGASTNSITVNVASNGASGNITVTATNGCGTSAAATLAVVKGGTANTFTDSPATWSAGSAPPTTNGTQNIVINGNLTTAVNLSGCTCTVNAGKTLTVASGTTLIIIDQVANSGTLTFENTASLVQINDAATNSGNITYKRNTQPMLRYDFTYWSSPVLGQTLGTPVTGLSPLTLSDKYFSFDTAANNWKQEANTTTMQVAKGYIVRAPQTHNVTTGPAVFNAVFNGVPNNGTLSCPDAVQGGVACLIGNPYPSAINADTFLTANNGVIDGTIYFWTHNTLPVLNNYSNTDYASYNFTGGTGTGFIADSGGGVTPNGKIAAGQSFFAVGKTGVVNGTVNFNNAMRVATTSGASGSNTQFFRKSNTKKTTTTSTPDKSRVWLNLSSTSGAFRQILVGYINGATNAIDLAYDGASFTNNPNDFYSINESNNLVIQGRAVPFDTADQVPLGYTSNLVGNFTISIDQTDGVLANQDIFIEDKLLGSSQNLKVSPYTFATAIGTFDNRFVLKFVNNGTFGTENLEKTNLGVLVFCKNKQIQIKATLEKIDKVVVFDVAGKRIYEKNKVGTNELLINSLISSEQVLIVKTILKSGVVRTQKIIFE